MFQLTVIDRIPLSQLLPTIISKTVTNTIKFNSSQHPADNAELDTQPKMKITTGVLLISNLKLNRTDFAAVQNPENIALYKKVSLKQWQIQPNTVFWVANHR